MYTLPAISEKQYVKMSEITESLALAMTKKSYDHSDGTNDRFFCRRSVLQKNRQMMFPWLPEVYNIVASHSSLSSESTAAPLMRFVNCSVSNYCTSLSEYLYDHVWTTCSHSPLYRIYMQLYCLSYFKHLKRTKDLAAASRWLSS